MLEGWIVEPSREVKAAAARLQESLRRFDWIDLVPEHFLHVWLGVPERLGDAPQRWPELAPFEIGYPRSNCFHDAVVVEVTQPVRRLVAGTQNDLPEFLPHMTVGVTRVEHPAAELRDTLTELREIDDRGPDRRRDEAGSLPSCSVDAVPTLGGRRDGAPRRARVVTRLPRPRGQAHRATRGRARPEARRDVPATPA